MNAQIRATQIMARYYLTRNHQKYEQMLRELGRLWYKYYKGGSDE